MPTADTFQTRGRRNGFPFCLENNVSELDNAFSTNTDGLINGVRFDRTDAILLEDLMFFFWNLHKFTTLTFVHNFNNPSGSGTATASGEGNVVSVNVVDGQSGLGSFQDFGTTAPRERVCSIKEDIYIANMGSAAIPELEQGFYFVPSRTPAGDPCIAYALNINGGTLNPATASNFTGATSGSEVSGNLPLNSSGTTVAIKMVGITVGSSSSTAVSGNIVADFYTYS